MVRLNINIKLEKDNKTYQSYYHSQGVIIERRNHKIPIDWNKLFNTSKTHKYF